MTASLCLAQDLFGSLRLHIGQRTDKVFDNLSALAVSSILDFLQLHFCLFVRILFGLLVSARVLMLRTMCG